jgi:tRNA-modifying protein YgfZ
LTIHFTRGHSRCCAVQKTISDDNQRMNHTSPTSTAPVPSVVATVFPTRPAALPASGSVPLHTLGVISAQGADAAKFLQGQLTNDVESLDAAHARWAGYCSAKGRLLATFSVLRPAPDTLWLLTPQDGLAATLKRLQMFVLRSACKLSDASSAWSLQGLWGAQAADATADLEPMAVRDGVLRLPDVQLLANGKVDTIVRAIRMLAAAEDAHATANPQPERADAMAAWQWLDTASGSPHVTATTADAFVPQMVNWELLGGVSFRKGCYPGQEVVARSQYRGTLKRRMHLFESDAAVAPGVEVFHAQDSEQPAGTVVNAATLLDAASPSGARHLALVSLKTALLDGTDLQAHAPSGSLAASLRAARLPYPVPNEATD